MKRVLLHGSWGHNSKVLIVVSNCLKPSVAMTKYFEIHVVMRDILGVIAWILRFSPLINAYGKEKGSE